MAAGTKTKKEGRSEQLSGVSTPHEVTVLDEFDIQGESL